MSQVASIFLSEKCQLKRQLALEKKKNEKRKRKKFLCLRKASKAMDLVSKESGVNYITCCIKKEHLLTRNTRRVITSGQNLNRALDLNSSVFSGLLTFNMHFF